MLNDDVLARVLADLAEHPDSSARDIAGRIGESYAEVFRELDNAAYKGLCHRWRSGRSGAWLWDVPRHAGPSRP